MAWEVLQTISVVLPVGVTGYGGMILEPTGAGKTVRWNFFGEKPMSKRCTMCAELGCRKWECVLGPEITDTVGEGNSSPLTVADCNKMAGILSRNELNTVTLGTRMSKNDPFADLRERHGWTPQDDAAFQFANRVQGIR